MLALLSTPTIPPLPADPGTGFNWQRAAGQKRGQKADLQRGQVVHRVQLNHWASQLRQKDVACGTVTCVTEP